MCGHETDGAGVPVLHDPFGPVPIPRAHPGAELTGGTIPAHVPGAYPNLSCCGGAVALVPAAFLEAMPGTHYHRREDGSYQVVDDWPPVVDEGPGWLVAPEGSARHDPSPVFAAVHLDDERGDGATRAVLSVRIATMDADPQRGEAGAELTLDDLAAIIARAAAIGAAAGIEDGRHRAALYFERAAEAMRLMEPFA